MDLILFIKIIIIALVLFVLRRFLILLGAIRVIKPENQSEESEKKKLQNEKLIYQRKKIIAFLDKFSTYINTNNNSFSIFEKAVDRLQLTMFGTIMNGRQMKGLLNLSGIVLILFTILWTLAFGFSILNVILLGAGFILLFGYQPIFDIMVNRKDKMLEDAFADLFLMVFTSIVEDTGTPLHKCISTFMKVNEFKINRYSGQALAKAKEIQAFAERYCSLLSKYPESTATLEMRKRYGTSALIVNFCTIVNQRLRGKDNINKLVTFKNELLQKSYQVQERETETRIAKGSMVINLIYIILVEVVIVSAIGGLPLDILTSIPQMLK